MYGAGRPSASRAFLVAAVVIVSASIAAGLSLQHHSGRNPGRAVDAASATGPESRDPDAAQFYAAVKTSMVPLLRHLNALQSTIAQIEDHPEGPTAGVVSAATTWADDMATARDLVGRLIPLPSPTGTAARDFFEKGAELYRESALTLARLPESRDNTAREATARSSARLRLLADRVLDIGKRLLDPPGGSTRTASVVLPGPVPVFPAGGDHCTAPAPPQGPSIDEVASATTTKPWIATNRAEVAAALALLDNGGRPEDLAVSSNRLGGPAPESVLVAQGTFAVRLALLVAAEGVCADAATAAPDAITQGQRLRRLGHDLWVLGTGLFGGDGHRWPNGLTPAPVPLDPALVHGGGLFGGHPPPLRPGDPPDLGVPGGLQLPDPTQALIGS